MVFMRLLRLVQGKPDRSARLSRDCLFLMDSMRLLVCRASASTLPKVHLDCLVFCWANKGAGVALMDTRRVRWVAFGNGKHLRRET